MDADSCTAADAAAHGDEPARVIHDIRHHCEPKPCACGSFGGEERIEHMGTRMLVHAFAIIRNGDASTLLIGFEKSNDTSLRVRIIRILHKFQYPLIRARVELLPQPP